MGLETKIIPTYLLLIMLLVVLIPAAALGTSAAQQGGNFMVSVAGTAVSSVPHQIDLKITQLPGGQISEVGGFIIAPEDVVQVKQGENLIVSTSPDLRTHQVTVRNMQGIPIDLVPLPSNAWSLQGLLPGVYTLDVNVAMSSSGILGIYETILVILEPDQQPLPPTTIINQITIRQPDGGCPGNLTRINGTCQSPPPRPGPGPGPCPNSTLVNGECPTPPPLPLPNTTIPLPNDTDSLPGLVPPPLNQTEPTPPITPFITPPVDCPEGQTGIPPNCQPINCDVENPPPECGEQPVVCPDGSTVSSGNECPEQPGLPPVNGGDGPPVNGGDGGDGSVDIPGLFN